MCDVTSTRPLQHPLTLATVVTFPVLRRARALVTMIALPSVQLLRLRAAAAAAPPGPSPAMTWVAPRDALRLRPKVALLLVLLRVVSRGDALPFSAGAAPRTSTSTAVHVSALYCAAANSKPSYNGNQQGAGRAPGSIHVDCFAKPCITCECFQSAHG